MPKLKVVKKLSKDKAKNRRKIKKPSPKVKLNVVPKGTFDLRRLQQEAIANKKNAKNKIDLKKRERIIKKILKMGRAEIQKKQKKGAEIRAKKQKKVKLNVVKKLPPKKEIVSELTKFTALTKTQANKLPAIELFGMLPVELRKNILSPSETGTQVGVAPPLSEDQTKTLLDLIEMIYTTDGFKSYIYGWSYYEGGNFTDGARKFFDKKGEQIGNNSFMRDMVDLLEEPKMVAIMKSTRKKYGKMEGDGLYGGNSLDFYFDANGEVDDQRLYNEDYEEYYPEDTYGLIYEDGDYNTSSRTRSTTSRRVKGVIDQQLKPEMKKFKDFRKEMKKLIK